LLTTASHLLGEGAPQHWDERVGLALECAGRQRQQVSTQAIGLAIWWCGLVQLAEGNRSRAEELWREVKELALRTRATTVSLFAARSDVVLAIVDGHLEDALVRLARYVERADESGAAVRGRHNAVFLLVTPALHLGRADMLLTALDEPGGPASLTVPRRPAAFFTILTAARAICLAQLGHLEEGRTLIEPLLEEVASGTDEQETPLNVLASLLPAAILFEHQAAAKALAARLDCVAHLAIGDWFSTCVARHLGDAAALAGNRDAARAYYVQALEVASRIRFRPEIALTHLHLAELMLKEQGDMEASEHLELAIPELRNMKMQPALERALVLHETVAPTTASAPAHASASDTLTAREREIARLMADGLSNRDIAQQLVITEGTVEVHVKHILGKLGFRSRAQVAGWFARQSPN
jgi:DNA-binding CsgD family transcriptional regulator